MKQNTPAQQEKETSAAVQQTIEEIEKFLDRMEKFRGKQAELDKRQDALEARLEKQADGQGDKADLAEADKLSNDTAV
jgi:hypothetical protein